MGAVDPKTDPVLGQKDTGVRGGSTVAIEITVPIPPDVWAALLDADDSASGGSNPDAHVLSELILLDGAGNEHVLRSVASTSAIDPKVDP